MRSGDASLAGREAPMRPGDVSLAGEVAFVTGGAQGIGRAIAEALARFGADVAIADRQGERAERVAHAIREGGRRALALDVDVRDEDALRAAVARARTELGRLDVLVNNAGGTFQAPFLQVNRRGFDTMLSLNLASVWVATQAAARHWIDTRVPGRVVNVATTEAFKACPGFAAYSAAKAGVVSLTKTLAAELGPYGIRVNGIAPDYTETESSPQGEEARQRRARAEERIPLGRYGRPDDMAGPVVFFASKLSGWVTGQTLIVDGGAWWAARVEGAFPFLPQDRSTREPG